MQAKALSAEGQALGLGKAHTEGFQGSIPGHAECGAKLDIRQRSVHGGIARECKALSQCQHGGAMMVEEGSHLPRVYHVACPFSGCALALAVSQGKAVLSQHKALSSSEPRFEMTIKL